jgi:phosphoserine phosphatase
LSLRAQNLLLRRKLGQIDHEQLLRRLQTAWHEAGGDDSASASAVNVLRPWARPELGSLLSRIATNEIDAVLATAAASEYAIGLGHDLGFHHIVATPCRLAADERLNKGAWKLIRVLEFLHISGWQSRPMVVLTDHLDDLPLMRHSDVLGWFGPPGSAAQASALAGGVKFIACRGLDGGAMADALSAMAAYARSFGGGGTAPSESTPA